jgi:hypothetical protein
MKPLRSVLLGIVIVSTIVSSAVAPAFALGGCGPNRHRNSVTGRCIFGGQNQGWCMKHTGRAAVRAPNGNMVCIR